MEGKEKAVAYFKNELAKERFFATMNPGNNWMKKEAVERIKYLKQALEALEQEPKKYTIPQKVQHLHKCPECGRIVNQTAKYCQGCGRIVLWR